MEANGQGRRFIKTTDMIVSSQGERTIGLVRLQLRSFGVSAQSSTQIVIKACSSMLCCLLMVGAAAKGNRKGMNLRPRHRPIQEAIAFCQL